MLINKCNVIILSPIFTLASVPKKAREHLTDFAMLAEDYSRVLDNDHAIFSRTQPDLGGYLLNEKNIYWIFLLCVSFSKERVVDHLNNNIYLSKNAVRDYYEKVIIIQYPLGVTVPVFASKPQKIPKL